MNRLLISKRLRTGVFVGLLALGMVFLTHSTAEALSIKLSDGVTVVTCNDGDPCDVSGLVGVVTFSGAIGTWIVNVTTAISKPILPPPWIDLNSVNVSSNGPGTLTIWASDTGFLAPVAPTNLGFNQAVGGTTGGTATFQSFADDGNALFAETTSLGVIGPFGGPAFSGTTSGSALLSGLYSLTLKATLVHGGGIVTSSFDYELQGVPEPSAAAMLGWGLGLIGLAGIGRRKLALKT
jgi:hypothetical protein